MALAGSPAAADAISTHGDIEAAVEEVGRILEEKIGRGPDLLLIYLSAEHRDAAAMVLQRLQRRLSPDAVAGCTVSGAIGGGRELQTGPCLSAFAARLPGTRVQAFHLRHDEEAAVVHGWPDVGEDSGVLLFPDPFSFPIEPFLDSLRMQRSELPSIVGGVASGASRAGGNVLFTEEGLFEHGAAGVVLRGSVRLAPLVSQGCRPIGPLLEITRSERNIVYELGGKPAYEGLAEMLSDLEEDERRRFMRAPHVGLRPLPSSSGEEARDFLVRGVTGVDPEDGAIALIRCATARCCSSRRATARRRTRSWNHCSTWRRPSTRVLSARCCFPAPGAGYTSSSRPITTSPRSSVTGRICRSAASSRLARSVRYAASLTCTDSRRASRCWSPTPERSARRPSHAAAAEHVEVHVVHGLAAVGSGIVNDSVTALR